MVKSNAWLVLVALGSLSLGGVASAEVLPCPASLEIRETLASQVPEGWALKSGDASRYLAGVSFFDGDPAEQVSLAPTRDTRSGNDRIAIWSFGKSSKSIWLACRYLQSGLSLTRALPATYTQCRLLYAPGGIVKNLTCQ